MIRRAISDRQMTVKALAIEFECCEITIKNTLQASDYHKRSQGQKPHLTKKQKAARLKFAMQHCH